MTRTTTPGARAALATALAACTLLAAGTARAQATTANPWSLGVDASLSSLRTFVGDAKGARQSLASLPDGVLRVGYRLSPMLQLEVPFDFATVNVHGLDVRSGTVGLNANLFFAPQPSARPFVGVGGFASYVRSAVSSDFSGVVLGDASSRSATSHGVVGRIGAELQATPSVSFRPTLFYRHRFELVDRMVGFDEFGAEFGSTIHFGPQGPATTVPSRVQVSYGAELARTAFGPPVRGSFASVGDSPPDVTTFQAPRALFGLLVPLSPTDHIALGANVAFSRDGRDVGAVTDLLLQPRAEFNANPNYRTQASVRLGLQGDYQYQHFSDGQSSDSRSQYGAGLDVSATHPAGRGALSRIGLGYDYLIRNQGRALPSQSRISLKFGFDAI